MKNRVYGQLFLYSLLHFCVDWACILLLTGQVRLGIADYTGWLWSILLYNAAAFALQLPLGALLDLLGRDRPAVWLGCILVALGWLFRGLGLGRCVIAGIGNALFHLGAGSRVIAHSSPKAGPSGIFVSTGAVGVWLGAWCARSGFTGPVLPLCVMLAGAGAALLASRPVSSPLGSPSGGTKLSGRAVWGCAFLFFTVCLRSWAGSLAVFPWQSGLWSLWAVLCVAGGKAAGGLLADRFGPRRCAGATLAGAALLFLLAPAQPWAGLLALFFFNTSMPLTLTALVDSLGLAHRALAFGLTTFALFWGTIPGMFRLPGTGSGALLCGVSLLSAVLIVLGLRWAVSREGPPC